MNYRAGYQDNDGIDDDYSERRLTCELPLQGSLRIYAGHERTFTLTAHLSTMMMMLGTQTILTSTLTPLKHYLSLSDQ